MNNELELCDGSLRLCGTEDITTEIEFRCCERSGHPGNHISQGSQYPGNRSKKKRKDYTIIWACADEV